MSEHERTADALGARVATNVWRNQRYGNTYSTAEDYRYLGKLQTVCPTARAIFDAAYRKTTLELTR